MQSDASPVSTCKYRGLATWSWIVKLWLENSMGPGGYYKLEMGQLRHPLRLMTTQVVHHGHFLTRWCLLEYPISWGTGVWARLKWSRSEGIHHHPVCSRFHIGCWPCDQPGGQSCQWIRMESSVEDVLSSYERNKILYTGVVWLQNFQDFPSHRILRNVHRTLNIINCIICL